MPQRFDDWPERLAAYLDARRSLPWQWAAHDCCAFACAGVAAQCGVDPMAEARTHYASALGAARYLARHGGLPALAHVLGAQAGLPEIPVLKAGRGCPVLGWVTTPGGSREWALGLVGLDSRKALFAAAAGGYVEQPVSGCAAAWGFD